MPVRAVANLTQPCVVALVALSCTSVLACRQDLSTEQIDSMIREANTERMLNDNPTAALEPLERAVRLSEPRTDQYWRAWTSLVETLAVVDPVRARDELMRVAEDSPDAFNYPFFAWLIARTVRDAGHTELAAQILEQCLPEKDATKSR